MKKPFGGFSEPWNLTLTAYKGIQSGGALTKSLRARGCPNTSGSRLVGVRYASVFLTAAVNRRSSRELATTIN